VFPSFVLQLLIGLGITLAVWLLSGVEWPGLVIGAVLAVSLWLMLLLGPVEEGKDRRVPPLAYLSAAVVGVALGYAFYRIGDENGSWWAVGFIIAGVALPIGTAATRGSSQG
jgi:hypothetical protein